MNLLLAGPVVRRAEPDAVYIWIATSQRVEARADIFEVDPGSPHDTRPLGSGSGECVKLGPSLFVHLIRAVPDGDAWPTDRLLGYDLELEPGDRGPVRLADLGLLEGPNRISFDGLPLPTFHLLGPQAGLRLLHGSCRMLHGRGEDALAAAGAIMARSARDLRARPALLYLTGDQIYGDEVGGPLIGHLTRLGSELMGPDDEMSVPDFPPLSEIPCNGREELVSDRAKFTSVYAANHLVSFGEYAASYLLAWSQDNWPASLPPVPQGLRRPDRRKYRTERRDLERTRATLPDVRRALANIPTYMAFDDHDITDDWNLTAGWCERVSKSPSGRRIVANALAAFWAFQGWGNDPTRYDDEFKSTISGFLSEGGSVGAESFEDTLWSFDRWAFSAPTNPPTIFLDTRTQREYDSAEGAARLIGKKGRAEVASIVRRTGHTHGEPLILVSPVPIYGLEMHERRQKFLKDRIGPYDIDLEEWHSNLNGLVDFVRFLIDDLGLTSCIFLSGDVHYGMTLRVGLEMNGKALAVTQLVSSALKHSGALSKTALDLLGKSIRRSHERLVWERLPASLESQGLRKRLAMRDVNTDDWSDQAPLVLGPRRAELLGIEDRPDLSERREYLPMAGAGTTKVIGENNAGLVIVEDGAVVHEMLCPGRGDIRLYRAETQIAEPGR